MNSFLIGQIVPFAGNFAPKGWMLCDGSMLPIARYTALFSILGTYYGGNGTTTFALPDLRGSAAVSAGTPPGRNPFDLGQTGGTEAVVMAITQMPAHTHALNAGVTIKANDSRADVSSPTNAALAQNTDTPIYTADPDGTSTLNSAALAVAVTVGNAGTAQPQPVPTLMPYLAVTYCICVEGIFPSRN